MAAIQIRTEIKTAYTKERRETKVGAILIKGKQILHRYRKRITNKLSAIIYAS
jgi:hypothetical protein